MQGRSQRIEKGVTLARKWIMNRIHLFIADTDEPSSHTINLYSNYFQHYIPNLCISMWQINYQPSCIEQKHSQIPPYHSTKNLGAQLGNLLVHSQFTSLVHYREMHFCGQDCAQFGQFMHVLGHLREKRCTSLFALSVNYQRMCITWALKCTRTWNVQVVHNLALKSAFPGSAQDLLPVSVQKHPQIPPYLSPISECVSWLNLAFSFWW